MDQLINWISVLEGPGDPRLLERLNERVPFCRQDLRSANIMTKSSGARQTWASYSASLGLSFLSCKTRIITAPIPWSSGENKMKQVTKGQKLSLSPASGHLAIEWLVL